LVVGHFINQEAATREIANVGLCSRATDYLKAQTEALATSFADDLPRDPRT
jgi:hypothetical protein